MQRLSSLSFKGLSSWNWSEPVQQSASLSSVRYCRRPTSLWWTSLEITSSRSSLRYVWGAGLYNQRWCYVLFGSPRLISWGKSHFSIILTLFFKCDLWPVWMCYVHVIVSCLIKWIRGFTGLFCVHVCFSLAAWTRSWLWQRGSEVMCCLWPCRCTAAGSFRKLWSSSPRISRSL